MNDCRKTNFTYPSECSSLGMISLFIVRLRTLIILYAGFVVGSIVSSLLYMENGMVNLSNNNNNYQPLLVTFVMFRGMIASDYYKRILID